ncbi:hypothetical protein TNCT_99031 [Trichonephila clavata]|uniref:Uncharacterized protein n=1 Tax=Trichonephila clavata TaxID=2740835 RepID=A0A8X6H3N7_TRICU|nr:hypothetical protein TNCT_99031 [Trichonephila clavata]
MRVMWRRESRVIRGLEKHRANLRWEKVRPRRKTLTGSNGREKRNWKKSFVPPSLKSGPQTKRRPRRCGRFDIQRRIIDSWIQEEPRRGVSQDLSTQEPQGGDKKRQKYELRETSQTLQLRQPSGFQGVFLTSRANFCQASMRQTPHSNIAQRRGHQQRHNRESFKRMRVVIKLSPRFLLDPAVDDSPLDVKPSTSPGSPLGLRSGFQ